MKGRFPSGKKSGGDQSGPGVVEKDHKLYFSHIFVLHSRPNIRLEQTQLQEGYIY